jgi:hypothetical protein
LTTSSGELSTVTPGRSLCMWGVTSLFKTYHFEHQTACWAQHPGGVATQSHMPLICFSDYV